MGCGKSTVGRALADELGWNFGDLDEDIEQNENSTILEIFEERGEPEFRNIEAAVLRERVRSVQHGRPLVLATGGGCFVQPQNADLMNEHGVTIWLDCAWDMVLRRVSAESHRPLARRLDELERLYQTRRDAYLRADYRIEVKDDDARAAVSQILALPLF
jgi:shikimate kinase